MSRRPPASAVERLPRAMGRMAPGGRMWSESPIPRFAIRKIRAAGESASGYPADVMAYSSATPPYPAFVCEWNDSITETVTESCVARLVFTLTAVDPGIDWFQIDAGGFASGERTSIPLDPHYHGYPTSQSCTGNRAINVTGGPFTVGSVVDVTFAADYLLGAHSGDFAMPATFTTSNAVLYIVSP